MHRVWSAISGLTIATAACCAAAQPAQQARYDIPAGSLAATINRIAAQNGRIVSLDPDLVRGLRAPAVQGEFTVDEALARALVGSGLQPVVLPGGALTLRRAPAQPVVTLDPVSVEGTPENAWGPVEGMVASRSATGTKTDAELREIPQSISVVTPAQIAAQGAQTLEQSLAYTPGVSIGVYGPTPEYDFVFTRGFQAQQYLDDSRLYKDYVTGAQLRIEPYGLERIEVLRGPSSVLYGQTPPGGMVNMRSKRPLGQPLHEVQLQAGSFDRAQGAFDFSGPVDRDGTLLYRLTGLARQSHTQTDYVEDNRRFIAPALTWQPSAATTLTLLTQFQKDWGGGRPVPLPAQGTLFDNPNGRLPTDRFLGEPGFDGFTRHQYSVGYAFEHQASEVWTFRQNLRLSRTDNHEKFSLPIYDYGSFPTDLRTVDRAAWDDRNRIQVFSIDNQAQARFATGPLAHTALVGLEYRRATNDWLFKSAAMPSIDAYDPRYGGKPGEFAVGIDQYQRESQLGLYAQDQVRYRRWLLTLGGRYDWARSLTRNRLTDESQRQNQGKFAGRVGITYLFDNGWAPYASYSTSFDPVAGVDVNGEAFKPTTGKQTELGVKYQPAGYESFAALSLFDLTRQNIPTRADPAPPDNPFGQTQIGEARVKGIELEGKAVLDGGWTLLASYTYLDSEITKSNDGTQGRPLFYTPRNQAQAWAEYAVQAGPLQGLAIGAGVRYRGKAWGDSYEAEIPDHTLVDAMIRYDLGRAWPALRGASLAINARNLFDKEYVSNCSVYEGCFYGDRRTVLATLKYQW